MMLHCFQKTEKGREEIATRKHGLSLRLRSILLLIDGKRSGDDLLQAYPGLGLTEALLRDLERQGYIAPASTAEETPTEQEETAMQPAAADACICTESDPVLVDEAQATEEPTLTSLILNTIFPAAVPPALDKTCEKNSMTVEDDHWKRPSYPKRREEHATLFEAIKACYLDGLRSLPPAAAAPLLRSLSNAQTTRALSELRPAYLEALRAVHGQAAAARYDEELDLLLFACAA